MAWLEADAPNIAQGWGGPPQLHAPEIGGLVHGILQNRLAQQEFQQKNIADVIKQMQDQRQSQAYTDALQKAGLLPAGDYGGLGIKGGESLADMIMRQNAEKALEAHRSAALGIAKSRGGGGNAAPDSPELYTDPDTRQQWRRGPSGRWIPMKSPSPPTPETSNQTMREQERLLSAKSKMDAEIATQQAANIKALKPDVPYSRSDEYNRTVNRLKQLQQMPGMPTTDVPGAISTPDVSSTSAPDVSTTPPLLRPPPSDQAGGHAQDYGVPTVPDSSTGEARVKVKSPDGKVGTLPASQLQDAISQGFTLVQ